VRWLSVPAVLGALVAVLLLGGCADQTPGALAQSERTVTVDDFVAAQHTFRRAPVLVKVRLPMMRLPMRSEPFSPTSPRRGTAAGVDRV
jgi:hypothetical protein